ncbi:MAG: hypothetical protein QM831_35150 [Kofleriaceae bacterium]
MKWVLLLALANCTVDRKSETLACSTKDDCDSDRTCVNDYCVKKDDTDCPDKCASCQIDDSTKSCVLSNPGNDCPDNFTCP